MDSKLEKDNHSQPSLAEASTIHDFVVDDQRVAALTLVEPEANAWKAGRREWLIILCLCLVSLIVALDATILVPALPTIASALEASTLETYWIGTSYLLSHAVVQPIISALSDIFGRRWLLLASVIFFTVGSLVACLAHAVPQMLAARVVQGVGGGGIIVLTLVIITDIVPLRQRPKFNAMVMLSWAVGTVAGPLIGGAFAESATWRWVFYLNFPFCGMALTMVPLAVKYKRPQRTILDNLVAVDWIGSALFIGGVTSFLMAVTWGGVQYSWASYETLVPLIVGILATALSLAWAKFYAKNPFIRISIYRTWSSGATIFCALLQGFLLYLGLYYLSLYFLSVRRRSPVGSGVAFLPLMLALLPSAAVTGFVVTRTGQYKLVLWLGWTIISVSSGLMILLGMHTPTVAWVFIFIVGGLGHGTIVTALNVALQASVESKYTADAAALYAFMRSLGMALGVGVGGAAFQNRLAYFLAAAGLPTYISTDAAAFVQFLDALPASDIDFINSVLGAYVQAFHNLFELSTAVACTGLVISLFIRQQSLDKKLETRHLIRRSVDSVRDVRAV